MKAYFYDFYSTLEPKKINDCKSYETFIKTKKPSDPTQNGKIDFLFKKGYSGTEMEINFSSFKY